MMVMTMTAVVILLGVVVMVSREQPLSVVTVAR